MQIGDQHIHWRTLMKLPDEEQVDLRLRKLCDKPGARGFLHELRRRIKELPDDVRAHFCRGGWRMEEEEDCLNDARR